MRVLIVKTSSMGDIIHTLPALTDATAQLPNVIFDWVVEENFAQIPSWHFAVERIIPVAIRRWRKSWFSSQVKKERAEFSRSLKAQKYDAIIDAQGLLKSAFLVARKAIGCKHGYDRATVREPMASWFYDVKHHVPKNLHAIERTRMLFAESLAYKLPDVQGDHAIAKHFLARLPSDNLQYLVFLHATTRDYKHWPEEAWRKLMELIAPTGLKVKLPWGTPTEQERAKRLSQGFAHVEVLPKLSLTDMATVLAGAKAVVSVDTGLSHLTAALDRPNIMLFGQTDPRLVGGYGKNQHTLLATDKQMKSISAQHVQQKLSDIFKIMT